MATPKFKLGDHVRVINYGSKTVIGEEIFRFLNPNATEGWGVVDVMPQIKGSWDNEDQLEKVKLSFWQKIRQCILVCRDK